MSVRRSDRNRGPPDRYTGGRTPSPTPWLDKYASRDPNNGQITIEQLAPLPIPSAFDMAQLSKGERAVLEKYHAAFEEQQRSLFKGFTARQLYDLDAVTTRKLRQSTLGLELHPILQRDRWEVDVNSRAGRELYSLNELPNKPDGLGGLWVAANDLVWEVMLPILRIATYTISSVHLLPFIDAFFFGQRKSVDNSRRPPNTTKSLKQIAFRDPPIDTRAAEAAKIVTFAELLGNFNFVLGFKENYQSPFDGSATNDKIWGLTGMSLAAGDMNCYKKVTLYLTYEMILPLMRPDLNDAERMGLEWFAANTLVHELIHAMWCVEDFLKCDGAWALGKAHEPYMGNDPISELGWALEFHLFGGSPSPFRKVYSGERGFRGMTSPLGFWLEIEYPTEEHAERAGTTVLLTPPLYQTQTYCPIPAAFYEDMQNDTFWDIGVRKYGYGVLHGRSRFQASRCILSREKNIKGEWFVEKKLDKQIENLTNTSTSDKLKALMSAIDLSPEDKPVHDFGASLWAQDEFEMNYLKNMNIMREKSLVASRELEILGRQFGQDPTVDERELYRVLVIIDEARTAHEEVVKNLIKYEKLTSKSVDRRKDLLAWNKDTREIVYEIRAVVTHSEMISPLQKEVIQYILRGLDWCVMNLWSIEDYKGDLDIYVPDLIHASKTLGKTNINFPSDMSWEIFGETPLYTELTPIVAPLSRSPEFFINAARLIITIIDHPEENSEQILQNKLTTIASALEIVKKYRNGFRSYSLATATFSGFTNECPKKWVGDLDLWVYIGEKLLDVYRTRLITMEITNPGYSTIAGWR